MSRDSTNMFYLGVFLCVVCALSAAIMGTTAIITQGPIAETKAHKASEGLRKILPDFDQLESRDLHDRRFFIARKQNRIVGYATASEAHGYAGKITGLVSFHPDGTIRTIIITEHAETPGLGANCMERVEEKTLASLFRSSAKKQSLPGNHILDQYQGHAAIDRDPWGKNWKVKKDGGPADHISGATISSRTVCELALKASAAFEAGRPSLMDKKEVKK